MEVREGDRLAAEVLAEVSNSLVRLFSSYYGRGPTKARTFAFDNYLLTALEDALTTVERTLVANGHEKLVRELRLTFQEEMADEFTGAVSKVTGRKVVAYHSQVVFDPDICFEVFVLEPPDTG